MNIHRSRLATFSPLRGTWYFLDQDHVKFGEAGGCDIPVPGSYNIPGRFELVVWRPADGKWHFHGGGGSLKWGARGDIPVPADYDGNGLRSLVVWRPGEGKWFFYRGKTVQFGMEGDIPVPGDYLGTGKAQIAVYRPKEGKWLIQGTDDIQFGTEGDIPVPGDYLGIGRAQIAVYRPKNGNWYFYESPDLNCHFGEAGGRDFPVPLDYGDEHRTNIAIWRPCTGEWFVKGCNEPIEWGAAGDIPVPGFYHTAMRNPPVQVGIARPFTKKIIDGVLWLFSAYGTGKGIKELSDQESENRSGETRRSHSERAAA